MNSIHSDTVTKSGQVVTIKVKQKEEEEKEKDLEDVSNCCFIQRDDVTVFHQ